MCYVVFVYVGVKGMVFLLVIMMIISPYRSWAVEDYNHLKSRNMERSLGEESYPFSEIEVSFCAISKAVS